MRLSAALAKSNASTITRPVALMADPVSSSGVRYTLMASSNGAFVAVVIVAGPGAIGFRGLLNNAISASVSHRFFGEEPLVAVKVAMNEIRRFAREVRHQFIQAIAQAQHVLRFDAQIRRRSLQDPA